MRATIPYRAHPWAPWTSRLLLAGGSVAWLARWPGVYLNVVCGFLMLACTLLAWYWRQAAVAYRTALEQQVGEAIEKSLRTANPDLVKITVRADSTQVRQSIDAVEDALKQFKE